MAAFAQRSPGTVAQNGPGPCPWRVLLGRRRALCCVPPAGFPYPRSCAAAAGQLRRVSADRHTQPERAAGPPPRPAPRYLRPCRGRGEPRCRSGSGRPGCVDRPARPNARSRSSEPDLRDVTGRAGRRRQPRRPGVADRRHRRVRARIPRRDATGPHDAAGRPPDQAWRPAEAASARRVLSGDRAPSSEKPRMASVLCAVRESVLTWPAALDAHRIRSPDTRVVDVLIPASCSRKHQS